MAVLPFETADVLLSIKQAAPITERHIDTTQFLHKSKFRRSFNLTATWDCYQGEPGFAARTLS